MKPRIIFVHGNQTTHWSFAWASWFKQKLEEKSYQTFFETFPDSIIARAQYWLPFLEEHVKVAENDVIVGWSSGAVAAMRYAETHEILGSILVSPCYTDLEDPFEKQSGYFDTPWDWENIKTHQAKIGLFYSDNDPFIPQNQFEFITEKLSPEVVKVPNAGHFIDRTAFPELLSYIEREYI